MKKIEAIIQTSSLGTVKNALGPADVENMLATEVRCHSSKDSSVRVFRGCRYSAQALPQIKIELMLPDHRLDGAVAAIKKATRSIGGDESSVFDSRSSLARAASRLDS